MEPQRPDRLPLRLAPLGSGAGRRVLWLHLGLDALSARGTWAHTTPPWFDRVRDAAWADPACRELVVLVTWAEEVARQLDGAPRVLATAWRWSRRRPSAFARSSVEEAVEAGLALGVEGDRLRLPDGSQAQWTPVWLGADLTPAVAAGGPAGVEWRWASRLSAALVLVAVCATSAWSIVPGDPAAPVGDRVVLRGDPAGVAPLATGCTGDDQRFVDELRCQVAWLSEDDGDGPHEAICGDQGSDHRWQDPEEDLQAAYCGLLDRARDDWTAYLGRGDRVGFAQAALTQACFNVLGHPEAYRLREHGRRVVADPDRMLHDPALANPSLIRVAEELEGACEAYRGRVEALVEGAIFATHVGKPIGDEPRGELAASRLRRMAFHHAMVGWSAESQTCFRTGMRGLGRTQYASLCTDEPARIDSMFLGSKIWTKLSSYTLEHGEVSLVARYAGTRFRSPHTRPPDLWQCHLGLASDEPTVLGARQGKWDLPIPIPDRYGVDGRGGVQSQLSLDATLGAIEEGTDAGVCWRLVARQLAAYTPVHPLLEPLDPDGWPSVEQQVCLQVCAAAHRVAPGANGDAWVTPANDLELCLTPDPGGPYDAGAGSLDELRLPWNDHEGARWPPEPEDVCAFNLLSTTWFVDAERRVDPKDFGGETLPGSRIIGGRDGLAVRYASSPSGLASAAACESVGLQCLTGVALGIMGDPAIERYRWLEAFGGRVDALVDETWWRPWCRRIQDALDPTTRVDQLDTPCVHGVERARELVEASLLTARDRWSSP